MESIQLSLNARGDYFRIPDKVFWSFSAGVNYRATEKLNGKIFLGRSFQSPFFVETQFDVTVLSPGFSSSFQGNQDMNLVTIDTAEAGIRYSFSDDTLFDWEVFISRARKFSDIETFVMLSNGTVVAESTFMEIPVAALQVGSTLSIQSVLTDSLSWQAYVTVQRTDMDDAAEFSGVLSDREHSATPSVYGGAVVNYAPEDQWNVNINGYYLDEQSFEQRHVDESSIPSSIYTTEERWVLNTKVSYQWNDYLSMYVNGRNLVNSRQPQLSYMDRLNSLWLAGVEIDF